MKPCITCQNKPLKNGVYKSHLELFVQKQLPVSNKCYRSKDEGVNKVKLSNLKPNKTIFYFATNDRDFTKSIEPRLKAYGKLENSGVVKTNDQGESSAYLKCPQLYVNHDDRVYSRHLHFLYWDDKRDNWDDNLYTVQMLCSVSTELLEKNMKKIHLVDARPEEMFEKSHLDHAISMPHNKRWTEEKVFELLGIKDNNKLVPIVLYGKKDQEMIVQLHAKLNKLGFLNTMEYP